MVCSTITRFSKRRLLSFYVKQHSQTPDKAAWTPSLALAVGGLIAVLDQRQRAERDRVIANFQSIRCSPQTRHLFRSLFHRTRSEE